MEEPCAALLQFNDSRERLQDAFSTMNPQSGIIAGGTKESHGVLSHFAAQSKSAKRDKRHIGETREVFIQSGIIRSIVALETFYQCLFKEAFSFVTRHFDSLLIEEKPAKVSQGGTTGNNLSEEKHDVKTEKAEDEMPKKNIEEKPATASQGKTTGDNLSEEKHDVETEKAEDEMPKKMIDKKKQCGASSGKAQKKENKKMTTSETKAQVAISGDQQIKLSLKKAKEHMDECAPDLSMRPYKLKTMLHVVFPKDGYNSKNYDPKKKLDEASSQAINEKLAKILELIADVDGKDEIVYGDQNENKSTNADKSTNSGESKTKVRSKDIEGRVPTIKLQFMEGELVSWLGQMNKKNGLTIINHLCNVLYSLRCVLVHGSPDATIDGALKDVPLYPGEIFWWGKKKTNDKEGKKEMTEKYPDLCETDDHFLENDQEYYNMFEYFVQLGRDIRANTLQSDYNLFLNVQNACSFLARTWTKIVGFYIYDFVSTDLAARTKHGQFLNKGKFWEWRAAALKLAVAGYRSRPEKVVGEGEQKSSEKKP